jgi:RNA polymerase sigma factor (TIGR02999 family)
MEESVRDPEPVLPESPGTALSGGGERLSSLDAMLPDVYAELRRIAALYLGRERPGHTLQPTALVHEAFLRLSSQRQEQWGNRAQLLGVAAQMMRRILVNHARDRAAAKRGGSAERVSLTFADASAPQIDVDTIALHEALEALERLDHRKGRVVELKYFGGLTTEEIADVLGVSGATVEREWKFARAWLFDAIQGAGAP